MIDLSKYNILEIYSLFFYNFFVNKINIDLIIGVFYTTIHFIYVVLICLVVLLNTNILHLFMMLIIITINVTLVIFCHTCPLMLLELKYLNIYALKSFFKLFEQKKKSKDKRIKKHLSKHLTISLDEFTLECLLLLSLIYIIKIMVLMICY